MRQFDEPLVRHLEIVACLKGTIFAEEVEIKVPNKDWHNFIELQQGNIFPNARSRTETEGRQVLLHGAVPVAALSFCLEPAVGPKLVGVRTVDASVVMIYPDVDGEVRLRQGGSIVSTHAEGFCRMEMEFGLDLPRLERIDQQRLRRLGGPLSIVEEQHQAGHGMPP